MKISVLSKIPKKAEDPLALFLFSNRLDPFPYLEWFSKEDQKTVNTLYQHMRGLQDIEGKEKEISVLYFPTGNPAPKIFLVGMGEEEKVSIEKFRVAASHLCRILRKGNRSFHLGVSFPSLGTFPLQDGVQGFVEGFILRNYTFEKYCQKKA